MTYSIVDNYIKAFGQQYKDAENAILAGDVVRAEEILDDMGAAQYEVQYHAQTMQEDIEDLEIMMEEMDEL